MKYATVIVELSKGLIHNLMVIESSSKARGYFESIVIEKGFREWKDEESFKDYKEAFWDWEDSDKCPYDKSDWQIHYERNIEIQ